MNKNRKLFIEKTAEMTRDECNVTDYGIQNIFEAFEKLEYRIIRYPLGVDSFLGFALIRDSEKIIFSNSSQILSRELFTVAHEMGHHKLHLSEQGTTLIKDDDFNGAENIEIESNHFAACLLMPEEKVRKFIRLELHDKDVEKWTGLEIARIQTAFGVSYDMSLVRLKSIGVLNDQNQKKLKTERTEHTTQSLLKAINGNSDLCTPSMAKKLPAEFLEWAISNYRDKLVPIDTLERALQYVGVHVSDLDLPLESEHEEESFEDIHAIPENIVEE